MLTVKFCAATEKAGNDNSPGEIPIENVVPRLGHRGHSHQIRFVSQGTQAAIDFLRRSGNHGAQRSASGYCRLGDLLGGGRIGRFKHAETLAKKPEKLTLLLQTWLGWWRDLLLMAHGQDATTAITNIDQRDTFATLAQQWDKEAILRSLKQTKTALWQLERNGNTRLVLENLFLIYPTKAA